MSNLLQNNNYIPNSISASRILQEDINSIKGTSKYELFSLFICNNMDKIDQFAEVAGNFFLEQSIKVSYEKQYSQNEVIGRVKRNLSPAGKIVENERNRRNVAFIKGLLTEASVKLGARGAQHWLNEKSKYNTMRQVYSLLYCMANDVKENANYSKANIELAKIRNSMPISLNDKRKLLKLNESIKATQLLEIPVFFEEGNPKLMEMTAYLLYAIACQKYDDEEIRNTEVLSYYDYLGFSDKYAQELLREHKNTYAQVSADQTKYLKVARGMVSNLTTCIPSIDARTIANHALEMAKYDPCCVVKRNVGVETRKPMTISDLYFKYPELVKNAGTVALSQFELDDNEKNAIMEQMRTWSIDDNDIETIVKTSKYVSEEAKNYS